MHIQELAGGQDGDIPERVQCKEVSITRQDAVCTPGHGEFQDHVVLGVAACVQLDFRFNFLGTFQQAFQKKRRLF